MRQKTPNPVLQFVFSLLLGLLILGLFEVVVNTMFPYQETSGDYYKESSTRYFAQAIAMVAFSTLTMVGAMFLPAKTAAISNGMLLGGLFAMVSAYFKTIPLDETWDQVAIVAVAVVITAGIGYWRFSSGRTPSSGTMPTEPAIGTTAATDPASASLEARVAAIEEVLETLRSALGAAPKS